MTHPASLVLALRDAGMTCRVLGGKLLVNPVAGLQGELREQVRTNRAALIAWLEEADQDNATADAVAAFWADHPDAPDCFVIRARSGEILGCASSVELAFWDQERSR